MEPSVGRIVRVFHPKLGWPEDGLACIVSKVHGDTFKSINGTVFLEDGTTGQMQGIVQKGISPPHDENGLVWDWPQTSTPPAAGA